MSRGSWIQPLLTIRIRPGSPPAATMRGLISIEALSSDADPDDVALRAELAARDPGRDLGEQRPLAHAFAAEDEMEGVGLEQRLVEEHDRPHLDLGERHPLDTLDRFGVGAVGGRCVEGVPGASGPDSTLSTNAASAVVFS